jgi:hypothetical protein
MNAPHEYARSWQRAESRKRRALVAAGSVGAVLAFCLMALPAAWYIGFYGVDHGRHGAVENELLALVALDARWEREALHALTELAPAPAANHAAALADITQRLEAAARETPSPSLQRGVPNVIRAYTEKAQRMGHFHTAHAAALGALRQALATEAEIAGLLRDVWHDAPDRQRLVAADNLVTQLLADAQRYYFVPTGSHRKNLEASAGDLHGAAGGLPDALRPPAARLESHIGDLLRAKPQQQLHLDRLRFHDAGPLAATLARELRLELAGISERQQRYRVYLAAYFFALLVLIGYFAARFIELRLATRSGEAAAAAPAAEPAPTEPSLPPQKRAGP